jgi:hypothetical protein
MRYIDFCPLNEVFHQPQHIGWEYQTSSKWLGTFVVGASTFEIEFTQTGDYDRDRWLTIFRSLTADSTDAAYGNTGMSRNHATAVLAHAISAIKEFIHARRPDVLQFAGDNAIGKGKLYTVIAAHLARQIAKFGYDLTTDVDEDDHTVLVLTRA